MCQLAAQEAGGTLQPLLQLWATAGQRGIEHLGMGMIARNLRSGQRHLTHPRILHLEANQFRQFAQDLFGDTVGARKILGHYSARATSTISNTSSWSPTCRSL